MSGELRFLTIEFLASSKPQAEIIIVKRSIQERNNVTSAVADLGGGWGGCIPPHQPKPNDFGRKISLNFGEDLFFFFVGDHLILGGKNV